MQGIRAQRVTSTSNLQTADKFPPVCLESNAQVKILK